MNIKSYNNLRASIRYWYQKRLGANGKIIIEQKNG